MSYDSVILADSPISYWKLADASGTTAADSADSNPGTYSGGYTLGGTAAGYLLDGSVALNGSTGYATVADASNLHIASPMSLEAWFKTSASGGTQVILGKYPPSTFTGYAIGLLSTGQLAFQVAPGLPGAGPTGYNDGKWHHAVGTAASSRTCTYYIDGVSVGTNTQTPTTTNTTALRIGTDPSSPGGASFNGSLSSVAIYSTVLSAAQVKTHYLAAIITGSGGLVLGGHVVPTVIYSLPASGGIKFGGHASPTLIHPVTPSGGMEFGGHAAPLATYNPMPSGGMEFGGHASPVATYNPAPSGGMEFGGQTNPDVIFPAIASGGMILGAHAVPTLIHSVAPTGGMVMGGHVAPLATYNPMPSGGMEFGGHAAPLATYNPAPSGGMVLDGHASPVATYEAKATGGMVFGGRIGPYVIYPTTTSGGLVFGGHAIPIYIPPTTSVVEECITDAREATELELAVADPTACMTDPEMAEVLDPMLYKNYIIGDTKDIQLQCWGSGALVPSKYASGDILSAAVYIANTTVPLFSPAVGWYTALNTQTGYDEGQIVVSPTNAQFALLVPSIIYTLLVTRNLESPNESRTESIARVRFGVSPRAFNG